MLSIEECRKKLGKYAENKTDEEIELIRNKLYSICEIVIDQVVKKGKNNNL
jgi:hypothetical protein